jgi:hypothetical protein
MFSLHFIQRIQNTLHAVNRTLERKDHSFDTCADYDFLSWILVIQDCAFHIIRPTIYFRLISRHFPARKCNFTLKVFSWRRMRNISLKAHAQFALERLHCITMSLFVCLCGCPQPGVRDSKNGFLTSPFTVTGAVYLVPSRPAPYALELTCSVESLASRAAEVYRSWWWKLDCLARTCRMYCLCVRKCRLLWGTWAALHAIC